MVLIRAMSRRTWRTRAGVLELAAGPLEAQVETPCRACRLAASARRRSSRSRRRPSCRHLFTMRASRTRVMDRQLRRREVECLFRQRPGTPSSSNMMRPGFTRHTQNSGAPLPLPMRTSAGFCDTGTSGKIRIHTRPTRRIWRVMARRAASIWRAVRRPGSDSLQAIGAEIERRAALGQAVDAALMRLAVFRALWTKHDDATFLPIPRPIPARPAAGASARCRSVAAPRRACPAPSGRVPGFRP